MHTDECYETIQTHLCGLEEDENHTHDDNCVSIERVLVCEIPTDVIEHVHTAECYVEKEVVNCSNRDLVPHVHNSNCYDFNDNVVCGQLEVKEHQHSDECFTMTDATISDTPQCGLEEHTPSDSIPPQIPTDEDFFEEKDNTGNHDWMDSIEFEPDEDEEDEVNEENQGSVQVDDWELSLNFYDRYYGMIADRTMTWDASDGSYTTGPEKEIVLQINYTERNTDTVYLPGSLRIKVPNLFYNCDDKLKVVVSLTANTASQAGREWSCVSSDNPSNNDEYFEFTNAEIIEAPITGNLQIGYVLTSLGDNGKLNNNGVIQFYPEVYEDSCYKEFSSTTYATLNDKLKTEPLSFNYQRTYNHPWERQQFTIKTTVEGTNIPDDIVENKNDYIIIKYTYYIPEHDYGYVQNPSNFNSTYPYYANITARLNTTFPDDCIVVNSFYEIEDNDYEKDYAFTYKGSYHLLGIKPIYVLYPRSIYNLENNNYLTTNKVDLTIEHESLGFIYNNTYEVEVNLGEFKTDWPGGEEGGIWVYLNNRLDRKYYSEIIKTTPNRQERAYPREYQMNFGVPFICSTTDIVDVYVGVDKIFITGADNEYRLLQDDEYFISCIRFPGTIIDSYGNQIPPNTYDIELYVRYRGEKEYQKLATRKNTMDGGKLDWDYLSGVNEKKIVGYYFKIKDVKNGIKKLDTNICDVQNFFVYIITEDVADFGKVWPFSYIDAIKKDGQSCLHQTIDDYAEFAKKLLAPLDLEENGYYLGRGTDSVEYIPISQIKFTSELGTKIETEKNYDDKKSEKFYGTSTIHLTKGKFLSNQYDNYFTHLSKIPDEQKIKGFECWNLLPYGMVLESSADDIKNTMEFFNDTALGKKFDVYYNDSPVSSIAQQLNDACRISIVENYRGTGRTLLHVSFDLGDNTAAFSTSNTSDIDYLNFSYNFSISYDAFMENSSYTNNVYADWITNKFILQNAVKDDNNAGLDILDINGNGIVDEKLAFATSTVTITDLVSSQQGLLKQVQTDRNNYKSGTAVSSLNSEYRYKLTVRTGSTSTTNLVVYDNLEEAYGDNKHWKGEFVDVDTSYAESKGYKVKVYYSENLETDTLDADNSWKEYSKDIDKSEIKSLAFEYLDQAGNPAVLPVNSMTYVVIIMRSPIEMDFNKSYNGSHVEWNPIDRFGNMIDGIVALDSNIVCVELPYLKTTLPETGSKNGIVVYITSSILLTAGFSIFVINRKRKMMQ